MIRTYRSGRVRVDGRDMAALREACLERDGWRCQWPDCGLLTSDRWPEWHDLKTHMAHIQSRGAGGSDILSNIRTLCGKHHREEHQHGKKG